MTNAQLSLSLRERFGSVPVSATVVLLTIMVFASGFGLARLFMRQSVPLVTNVPQTDYIVPLPEGTTTITVTDPLLDPDRLVQFTVNRVGSNFDGIPRRTVRVPAREDLPQETVAYFRHELTGILAGVDQPAERANAIREWLFRHSGNRAGTGLETRDPREAYVQMRQGRPVLCGNLADIYVGLCRAAGLNARTVSMSIMIRKDRFGADTHVAAEVWLPEFGGWVYQDPTFNCFWEIDGRPAGALALHQALLAQRPIIRGPKEQPPERELLSYYVDPRLFFSHIYFECRIGRELLYYLDEQTENIDLNERNWLQTDNDSLLQAPGAPDTEVSLDQGEIAPGIFVQLIKGKLFVRDRRPDRRGIRVRSSSGPVQACAYDHWRANDLGVFDRANFVRNGSFQHAAGSAQLADDWSVDGRIDGMTLAGGQGLGVGPGGRLFQRFRVEPNRSYLLYAKVSVARGRVEWRLADPTDVRISRGTLDAGRIDEVLSDAVVSDGSGLLDVEFTAPEGGGFRVLDVIVCEFPRGETVIDPHLSVRQPVLPGRANKKGRT
jgi:hypothetical protein